MYSMYQKYLQSHQEIETAIDQFLLAKSSLTFALNDGDATRKLIESEKINSSNQYRYGKLPHLADIAEHWKSIREDLCYFYKECQIAPHPDIVEACLFWRLKTGRSLAERAEDILGRNLELHQADWFSLQSLSGISLTDSVEGKKFSVLGLPAFGKSHFSENMLELGDFRLLDPDAFRFYTMAEEILKVDRDLFDQTEEGTWQLTQHLYGPVMRNVSRLLYLSTALPLAQHGHDILANGFILVDEDESDKIFWIESKELPLKQFLEMKFPPLEVILRLQETSRDEADFISRIDSPDLLYSIQIVDDKVKTRSEKSRGRLGDFPWDNPTYQPILELQKPGANTEMNLVDIAVKIVGMHETILALVKNGQTLIPVSSEGIPSPERVRFLVGPESSESVFTVTRPSRSRLLATPREYICDPAELYAARLEAIDDCEKAVLGIPKLVRAKLDRLDNPDVPKRTKPIASLITEKCMKVFNGIITQAPKDEVHHQVLEGLDSEKRKHLLFLAALILKYGLTYSEQSGFHWKTRWEPELQRYIPAPLHSLFILPHLGMRILDEGYDSYRFTADSSHDLLEEATMHPEVDGVLQKGTLYSKSSNSRTKLLDILHNYEPVGASASFYASILTDAFTDIESKEIVSATKHLFNSGVYQAHRKAVGNISLGVPFDSYAIAQGPVRFSLLSLQKQIAFRSMVQQFEISKDEEIIKELIGGLSCSFRDVLEAVLTIHRYLDTEFIELAPEQARAKIISYSGRLLSSHSKMMETYIDLPEDVRRNLSAEARSNIPALHWAIDYLVNPRLVEKGLKPIRDVELYRFYWDFYAPLVEKLMPALQPFAEARVEEAFQRRGWS